MGAVVLDTSVLIAFLETNDALHPAAVAGIRAVRQRDDELVLPATVLAETLVGAHRTGTAAQLRRDLVAFFGGVRVVDDDVAAAAAALRHRYRWLRLPDALVLATGAVDDAIVLTGDQRLGRVDPRVQVMGV